jgi:hypothetical protein
MAYINQKAGFVMFRETLFEDSLALLEKANTDPRLIIRLFPPFNNVDISSIYLYSGVKDIITSLATVESAGIPPSMETMLMLKWSINYREITIPS